MMKKITLCVFFLILMFCPLRAEAIDNGASAEYEKGFDDIIINLPPEVEHYFDKNNISKDNILSLSPDKIFGMIWDGFQKEVTKPLKMLALLVGVTLLAALIGMAQNGSGVTAVFNLVTVIVTAGMIVTYISECLIATKATVSGISGFIVGFIPIFAGIVATSGQVGTATVFSSIQLLGIEFFSGIAVNVLLPLCGCILGVSIAGAMNKDLKITKIGDMVSRIIVFALGLLLTVFVGLLSLQSFVAGSADSLAMKAARFTIANAVPIVGGAVSDALTTVKGSLSMVRSTFGAFGIIASVVVLAPTLLSVVCYKLAFIVAGVISDIFSVENLSTLLKSCSNVLTIIIAIIITFMLLFISGVGLMLSMGNIS